MKNLLVSTYDEEIELAGIKKIGFVDSEGTLIHTFDIGNIEQISVVEIQVVEKSSKHKLEV